MSRRRTFSTRGIRRRRGLFVPGRSHASYERVAGLVSTASKRPNNNTADGAVARVDVQPGTEVDQELGGGPISALIDAPDPAPGKATNLEEVVRSSVLRALNGEELSVPAWIEDPMSTER